MSVFIKNIHFQAYIFVLHINDLCLGGCFDNYRYDRSINYYYYYFLNTHGMADFSVGRPIELQLWTQHGDPDAHA